MHGARTGAPGGGGLEGGDGLGAELEGSLLERYPSGAAFVLPPYVFRQANLDGFDGIVAQVHALQPPSGLAPWPCYCPSALLLLRGLATAV